VNSANLERCLFVKDCQICLLASLVTTIKTVACIGSIREGALPLSNAPNKCNSSLLIVSCEMRLAQ